MNDGLIPNRYAKALYKAAAQEGSAARVYASMKRLESSFAAEPRLQRAVENPYMPAADKQQLLLTAADARNDKLVGQFFALIIDNNRVTFARGMALAYLRIYRERNDIKQVTITTAAKLPEASVTDIRKVVERYASGSTLEYDYRIDPQLIGGFTIAIDSTMLDASLKNELKQLRQKLLS